jgi:mono/diheme cytochrome c family protein
VRAQGNPEAAKMQNPTPASAESIGAGQQLYRRYCASCHGSNAEGRGGQRPHSGRARPHRQGVEARLERRRDLRRHQERRAPELNMVPFADQIKDPDIWHIVNYVKSIAKK